MTRAERAVVIGGSIAGILAARALREHVRQVVILDRDDMPSRPDQRGGVPQGRHAHGLLARGLQLVEEMFPGVTDTWWRAGRGWRTSATTPCGASATAHSRPSTPTCGCSW